MPLMGQERSIAKLVRDGLDNRLVKRAASPQPSSEANAVSNAASGLEAGSLARIYDATASVS
jgi:hypothetical protein